MGHREREVFKLPIRVTDRVVRAVNEPFGLTLWYAGVRGLFASRRGATFTIVSVRADGSTQDCVPGTPRAGGGARAPREERD